MIVFVDPFNHGLSHVPINAGVVETAVAADPDESLLIAAHDEHLAGLYESLDDNAKRHVISQISITPAPAGTRFISRFLYDLQNLKTVIGAADNISTLILADLAPSTLYALRVALLICRSTPKKIVAVLHGNASELAGWRARNPFIRATQLCSAMNIASRTTSFLVLEDAIRDRLCEVSPQYAHQFVSLPHPLPSEEVTITSPVPDGHENVPTKIKHPIRIAFLGAAQEKKGFGEFLKLAEQINAQLPGKAEFHVIGWMSDDCPVPQLSSLARKPSTRKLNRAEFLHAVQSIDYVCLPYNRDLYQYSASGTLLDAITATKPIFAISSPTLDDLQKKYGDFGIIADDMQLLTEQIKAALIDHNIKKYQDQRAVMQLIRHDRLPDSLKVRWKSLVENGVKETPVAM